MEKNHGNIGSHYQEDKATAAWACAHNRQRQHMATSTVPKMVRKNSEKTQEVLE